MIFAKRKYLHEILRHYEIISKTCTFIPNCYAFMPLPTAQCFFCVCFPLNSPYFLAMSWVLCDAPTLL